MDTSLQHVDTVVLDVDGTLVDTVYHHVIAWDQAFRAVEVTVPLWRVHRAIGMGGDRLVTEVAGDQVEAEHGDKVRSLHDEIFGDMIEVIHPLPGAADLLRELRRRGLNVVIASSGEPEQTTRLLELVHGDEVAQDRTSSGDVEESKPAPDLVDAAIEGVEGSTAVVIGDAVWDVKSARNSGQRSIGLLCGGFGEDELRNVGADRVFATPQELLDNLDEIGLTGP